MCAISNETSGYQASMKQSWHFLAVAYVVRHLRTDPYWGDLFVATISTNSFLMWWFCVDNIMKKNLVKSKFHSWEQVCSASYVSWQSGTARIWPPHAATAARQLCSNRMMSPGRWAHSSKPTAVACSGRVRQTDGRKDAKQMHWPCYAGSTNKTG